MRRPRPCSPTTTRPAERRGRRPTPKRAGPRPTTPDALIAPEWAPGAPDATNTPCPACWLPHAADVVALLAAERGRGVAVNTLELRRAAIRYHFIAGLPILTAEAQVALTMASIHRADAGVLPGKKLGTTADVLREILAGIPDDLAGRRDRALLLVGFAGALRCTELAAIRVEHLEPSERGLCLTLPLSKRDRTGSGVIVAIPYGTTELCPVRALRRWQEAANITAGPVFRRPSPVVGSAAIDSGTNHRDCR